MDYSVDRSLTDHVPVATLRAPVTRTRSGHPQMKYSVLSPTIRKQEEKLAAQQREIDRLIEQAFGRRSERYLESPQQLKIDFGGGPEVTVVADGLQQAVDEKQLADEAVAATPEVPSTRLASPPKKKKKRDESLAANLSTHRKDRGCGRERQDLRDSR